MPSRGREGEAFRITFRLHGAIVRLSTKTSHLPLACEYEQVVRRCLDEGYADLLERIVRREISLSLLREEVLLHGTHGLRDRVQSRIEARDLLPLIDEWACDMARRGAPSQVTIDRYVAVLHALFAGERAVSRRTITAEWLSGRLASVRNAHKARVAFHLWWKWLRVRGHVDGDPMQGVPSSPAPRPRDRWIPGTTLRALLDAIAPKYRDAIELAYATGIEVTPLLALRAEDVRLDERLIYARGTKTKFRTRWVRVADYAWPTVERLVAASVARGGRLFPTMNRHTVSKAHSVAAAKIGEAGLQLRDARHAFCVRLIKAGVPLGVVARQMGHASLQMVSQVYGQYAPDAAEMGRWETVASAGTW